jgi:predicted nucleotidyltransferase
MANELSEIVNIIKDELRVSVASELILFGSRAKGNAIEDSDYDFMLIVDDNLDANQIDLLSFSIRKRLLDRADLIPVDLIIKRKKQYQIESTYFGSLAYNAKLQGVEL